VIGIYKIQSNIDNQYYIGSSIHLERRWKQHQCDLKTNKHPNQKLQKFVNKYGLDKLEFEILETCNKEALLIREQFYLSQINVRNSFNISKSSTAPMMDRKHSQKTILRMCEVQSKENNPIFGTKRPKHVVDAMQAGRKLKRFSSDEKLKRLINLPDRKEVSISKDDTIIRCFSKTHASKIIGVSVTSINGAIKNNRKTKLWTIIEHDDKMYNIISPQLITMLKTL